MAGCRELNCTRSNALPFVAERIFDEIRAANITHKTHIRFRRAPAVNEQNFVLIGNGSELFSRQRRFHSETFGNDRIDLDSFDSAGMSSTIAWKAVMVQG